MSNQNFYPENSDQAFYQENKTNTLAIVGLIFGVISVLMILVGCCFFPMISGAVGTVTGIAALILGILAKKQIKEQVLPQSQNKMAIAAIVLGIIGTILGLITLALAIITNLVFSGPIIEQQFQDIIDQLQNQ